MPAYKMEYGYKDPPKSINFGASYQEIILRFKLFIFSVIYIWIGSICYGQSVCEISMHFFQDTTDRTSVFPSEHFKIDSIQIASRINHRIYSLYELGYLTAYSNIIFNLDHTVDIQFFTGEVYSLAKLSRGNVSEEILNKIGYDARTFNQKPYSHHKVVKLFNAILNYAENHGYPFASVKLDSIKIEKNTISSWLNYQSGPSIIFDSLVIQGYDKVKTKYLMTHLGIYQGEPYEEKLIEEIPNRLKLLSFVSLKETPEVRIIKGKCNIYVQLRQNKVSKLNGILGILPNQKDGKSVLITGQLNLDLHNLFSSGKRLALEWQSYDAESQLLDALYFHPNLFRTPLNIQGNFYLLKQDTTFINRKFGLELSLLSKNSSKIGFQTELITSRLISTYGLEDAMELPENNDYNLNYYGFNYQINRFNNINLPTKGWAATFVGSVGQKKIIMNPVLDDELYAGIEETSMQLNVVGEIEKYWKFMKNVYLRTKLSGGYLNGKSLFHSDLFRIGGLRNLRGFVENQFYTSSYGIANIELRAMFSKETYFLLFFDQSALIDEFQLSHEVEYPFGAGAGFSFSTEAGIFNFVFAMGKSASQPFSIEYSKIHFGYISRF